MDVSGCKFQEFVVAKVLNIKEFLDGQSHSSQVFLKTAMILGVNG
jgi:hypothetical protein